MKKNILSMKRVQPTGAPWLFTLHTFPCSPAKTPKSNDWRILAHMWVLKMVTWKGTASNQWRCIVFWSGPKKANYRTFLVYALRCTLSDPVSPPRERWKHFMGRNEKVEKIELLSQSVKELILHSGIFGNQPEHRSLPKRHSYSTVWILLHLFCVCEE